MKKEELSGSIETLHVRGNDYTELQFKINEYSKKGYVTDGDAIYNQRVDKWEYEDTITGKYTGPAREVVHQEAHIIQKMVKRNIQQNLIKSLIILEDINVLSLMDKINEKIKEGYVPYSKIRTVDTFCVGAQYLIEMASEEFYKKMNKLKNEK